MSAMLKAMTKRDVSNVQKALNEMTNNVENRVAISTDGSFGPKSVELLKLFQRGAGLTPDGIYGPATHQLLEPLITSKYLTEKGIEDVATLIGCEVKALKAVMAVEAKGSGFLPSGNCVILFERHKFYLYLSNLVGVSEANKVAATNPDICNPKGGGYIGGQAEWTRMATAMMINHEAAWLSASWGLGQVMGFNYMPAGYKNVFSFVDAMETSEFLQLEAMANFIIYHPSMRQALKNKNWAGFAEAYNGRNYKQFQYDTKLAAAYKAA